MKKKTTKFILIFLILFLSVQAKTIACNIQSTNIAGIDTVCEYSAEHRYSVPFMDSVKYEWSINNGTITENRDTLIVVSTGGVGSAGITLIMTDTSVNCTDTLSRTIIIIDDAGKCDQCIGNTPSYTIDLSNNLDSIWFSPNVKRVGQCCGVSSPTNCIEFWVTLAVDAEGIKLDIVSGALPGGALYYQINCGGNTNIGEVLCLNGQGPHRVTFCKPGNNDNVYRITSIGAPSVSDNIVVSDGCVGQITATGYDVSSITWGALSNSNYDDYLSCTSGCDVVSVVPTDNNFPQYVDYKVCGMPLGGCAPDTVCQVARVFFVSDLTVEIIPQDATVCYGDSSATITASVSGGSGTYTYNWSTNQSSQTIDVGEGTFYVTVSDTTGCPPVSDSVTVSSFDSDILADAGNDTLVCIEDAGFFQLNGFVQAAAGGVWTGGNGIFVPDSTALDAIYYPTATEIQNANLTLYLTTTGNGTCPADYDTVEFTIELLPDFTITGSNSVCSYTYGNVYSAQNFNNHTYSWNSLIGTISSGSGTNSIEIDYASEGTDTISLTVINNLTGCEETEIFVVDVIERPIPVISGINELCDYTHNNTYSTPNVNGHNYSWSSQIGTITSGAGTNEIEVSYTTSGSDVITLTQTNPTTGCDSTVTFAVTINPKPVAVINGPTDLCHYTYSVNYSSNNVSGHSYSWTSQIGNITSGANTYQITIDYEVSGTDVLTLTQTNITTGCDSVITLAVDVNERPLPVISGPDVLCDYTHNNTYSTPNVNGHNYSWSSQIGTITSGAGTNEIEVSYTTSGSDVITLTQTNPTTGCDSTVTFAVTINPKPVAVINGPTDFCQYSYNLNYSSNNVSGHSYSWTSQIGNITSGANTYQITIDYEVSGTDVLTLTQTNTLTGCDSVITLEVKVNDRPTPVITGDAEVCEKTNGNVYSTQLLANHNYSWTSVNGTITSGVFTNQITVDYDFPGTDQLSVRVTNTQTGCDSLVTLNVTINKRPEPIISGPVHVCEYSAGHIFSTPNVNGHTYNWSINNGKITSGENTSQITVKFNGYGSDEITLIQTNSATGCYQEVSYFVNINQKPVPQIQGDFEVCGFTSGYIYEAPQLPGMNYLWSTNIGKFVNGNTSNRVILNYNDIASGNDVLTLTMTNQLTGCDSTITAPVTILNRPQPVITGNNNEVCVGTSGHIFRATYQANHSYIWSSEIGSIDAVNLNEMMLSYNNSGTDQVKLIMVNNSTNCRDTAYFEVTVFPKPQSEVTGQMNVCAGASGIKYYAKGLSGHSYQWTVNGGVINGSTTANQIDVNWFDGNQGKVQLLKTNNNTGCDTLIEVIVNINPLPISKISGDYVVCAYNENAYGITYYSPDIIYNWHVSGGEITELDNESVTVHWSSGPGTGMIVLDMFDMNTLCRNLDTLHIQIQDGPDPKITGDHLEIVCELSNKVSYRSDPKPDNSFVWKVTGGQIVQGQGTNEILVNWGPTGTGIVELRQTHLSTGCVKTVSIEIEIINLPESRIFPDEIFGCAPFDAYLIGDQSFHAVTYFWDFGDGNTSNKPNLVHTYLEPGIYEITLITHNSLGCADTVTSKVEVISNPVADFEIRYLKDDQSVLYNNDSIRLYDLSIGAVHYTWDFGDGTIRNLTMNSNQSKVPEELLMHSYREHGRKEVSLYVENEFGCWDKKTEMIKVEVRENMWIPNAFSPDDNTVNDYFSIYYENVSKFRILILTRWGEIMYESDDPDFKWDGTYKGNLVPEGVYLYVIHAYGLSGDPLHESGTINLLR